MAVADTKLRNAKPKEKRYTIPVGENIYLEVMPTGLKSWRMRYLKPEDKKSATWTIDRYPNLGQVEAHQAKQDNDSLTFEVVARRWHAERIKAGKWKPKHAAKIIKSFENDIFPKIGHRKIIDIDAPLFLEVMQPIIERGRLRPVKN